MGGLLEPRVASDRDEYVKAWKGELTNFYSHMWCREDLQNELREKLKELEEIIERIADYKFRDKEDEQ